jgi:lipid A 3-O-deacylase
MKKTITLFFAIIFLSNSYAFSAEKNKFFKPWGANKNSSTSKTLNTSEGKTTVKKKEKFFKPWGANKNSKKNNSKITQKRETFKQSSSGNRAQNISVYTGTFDIIDKEGDDQTNLVGIEHKNKNLFRDTWIGKFSPTTGAFVTGKSSIYLYTGVEADYNLGPINISPSFAPGYYEAGDGKNLGSALEFKSEVKVGIDLFENSNLGYSYSHISNNDWGDVNPGTDNQSITFSKKF